MEGDFIKTYPLLSPLSWIYGAVMRLRNWMFNVGLLRERQFPVPVISVGNITVGGCGKTPHVEYLVRLLAEKFQVAVLSRGYKRKSHGYVLADEKATAERMGDEPMQIHKKFPTAYVAVHRDRCQGIMTLLASPETCDVEAVILDDAYQHRYVKPGLNILLIDYHRLITSDRMLPAGRLREPAKESKRADIVVVTKCPDDLTPMNYRVLQRTISLMPYQELFFTSIVYGQLKQLFGHAERSLKSIQPNEHVLLMAGIASPEQIAADIKEHCFNIHAMKLSDHHRFSHSDVKRINTGFAQLPSPKIIITTEKDAVRLAELNGLSDEVRQAIFVLPIEVKVNMGQQQNFDERVVGFVERNSRKKMLQRIKAF